MTHNTFLRHDEQQDDVSEDIRKIVECLDYWIPARIEGWVYFRSFEFDSLGRTVIWRVKHHD